MNTKNFFIAVLVQIILIALIFIPKSLSVKQGTPLIFNIEAVDPTDPFRGDFLTYRLSNFSEITVEFDEIEKDVQTDIGKTVYMPISSSLSAQAEPEFTFISSYEPGAYNNFFRAPEDKLFIRGIIKSVHEGFGGDIFRPVEPGMVIEKPIPNTPPEKGLKTWVYTIEYGVEDYFIPEGIGLSFPGFNNSKVRLIIDSSGNATADQVFIDGKPWP